MTLGKALTIATATGAALCFVAGGATAQVKKPAAKSTAAAPAPKPFAFPEVPAAPRPPGAPTMEEALAAYLASDRSYIGAPAAATGAPSGAASAAPRGGGRILPPILTIGPVPDPSHIKFTLPDDIPWTGAPGGNQTWNIVGSPTEPGPYLQMMKWWPGAYSNPHMHPNTRNMLVVSGTWWVCACATQDKTKTYPMTAGSTVTEPGYTYHWDGARNEPAVLMIWGNGPSPNIAVDENGMPKVTNAPRAPTAGMTPVAAPKP